MYTLHLKNTSGLRVTYVAKGYTVANIAGTGLGDWILYDETGKGKCMLIREYYDISDPLHYEECDVYANWSCFPDCYKEIAKNATISSTSKE